MGEKRKHYRLSVELDVKSIELSGKTIIEGKTVNISFGGVLIKCPQEPHHEVGCNCRVSISLPTIEDGITLLEFDCLVTHNHEGLVGVKFLPSEKVDNEAYIQFKSFMMLNCPDPEIILEELFDNDPVDLS